jgi:predicted dehydrogenase
LIFGCGSIGVRHLQALEEINDVEMAAYRTGKGKKEIPEKLLKNLNAFFDEEEAFTWEPDFLIVSNPTSLHLEYLLKAIDHNVDAFIEKPVASNYREIEAVEDKIRTRKNKIYVGFNLRFHPIIREISRIIGADKYGRVLKADLYAGSYLPFWHPYEDYRTSYSAKKELGGGALRTLCHEIDLGQYLFGDFNRIFARVSRISDLGIDVDDNTDILAEMKSGVLLKITMDYLNPVLERRGRILFEKGLLEYNFSTTDIMFTDYDTKESQLLLKLDNYDCNTQYKYQMERFINKSNEEICTLDEGINVTRIIDICEESSQTGRMLRV